MIQDLQATGGIAYTDFEPRRRHRIQNLEEHPLLDKDGVEVSIYNARGNRVPRRYARVRQDSEPFGVLVKLGEIGSLFDNTSMDEDFDMFDDDASRARQRRNAGVTIYPQSYFGDIGHVKANSVTRSLEHVLSDHNRIIRESWNVDRHEEEEEEEEEETEENNREDMLESSPHHLSSEDNSDDSQSESSSRSGSLSPSTRRSLSPEILPPTASTSSPSPERTFPPNVEAISTVCMQMYCDSVHCMHVHAGSQETQKGLQTAALASAYGELSDGNRTKGERYWTEADAKLPYERQFEMLAQQVNGNQPKDLRIEVVFSINTSAFRPDNRTGS